MVTSDWLLKVARVSALINEVEPREPTPTQLPYAKSGANLIRPVGISPAGLSHLPYSKYEIGYCNNKHCNIIWTYSFALPFSIPNKC